MMGYPRCVTAFFLGIGEPQSTDTTNVQSDEPMSFIIKVTHRNMGEGLLRAEMTQSVPDSSQKLGTPTRHTTYRQLNRLQVEVCPFQATPLV